MSSKIDLISNALILIGDVPINDLGTNEIVDPQTDNGVPDPRFRVDQTPNELEVRSGLNNPNVP